MKSNRTVLRHAILLTVVIVAVLGLASEPEASPPSVEYPFEITLEPVEMPESPGPVQMRLTLAYNLHWCTEIKVSIDIDGQLEYRGEESWDVALVKDRDSLYSKTIDIVIADNDTSGLLVELSCARFSYTWRRYFVIEDGNVEYWRRTPCSKLPTKPPPPDLLRRGYPNPGEFPDRDTTLGIAFHPDSLTYIRIDLRAGSALQSARGLLESLTEDDPPGYYDVLVTGRVSAEIIKKGISTSLLDPRPWEHDYSQKKLRETDSLGNVIEPKKKSDLLDSLGRPIGPIQRFQKLDQHGNPTPPESSIPDEYLPLLADTSRDAQARLKMKLLEREPLTEYDGQTFLVDGKIYHRSYGEKEFYEELPMKDDIEDIERLRDSLAALPLSVKRYVCLDLRDPEHLEYALKQVADLEPSNESGYYHGRITRGEIHLLSRHGTR